MVSNAIDNDTSDVARLHIYRVNIDRRLGAEGEKRSNPIGIIVPHPFARSKCVRVIKVCCGCQCIVDATCVVSWSRGGGYRCNLPPLLP